MKRAPFFILATIGLMAIVAAGPAVADDSKEFAAFSKAWADAYNAKDAAAIAAMYAEDGTLMPPHAPSAKGRQAIEAFIKTDIAGAPGKLEITLTDSGTSGNLGFSRGTFSMADATGKAVDTGKWLEVRKKVNGKWLIQFDIWNSDAPMAE